MIIPKSELKRYKKWVLDYGYPIDMVTLGWFYRRRHKLKKDKGYYIISICKNAYRLEQVADKFIEGAKA